MTRSEYLKEFLTGRGTPASSLTVRELTPAEVRRMSEYEYEWHRRENRENLEKALRTKADKQTELSKLHWQRFTSTRNLTLEQVQTAKAAVDRLCREFPAFVNNERNQQGLTAFLIDREQLPTWETVCGAYLELAPTGRMFLDPSRVGIMRFGEDGIEGYAVSQLTAGELKAITSPRSQSERQKIDAMSADEYWRAYPELARARYGDAYYARPLADLQRQAAAFLAHNPSYEQTDSNSGKLINFIKANGLPFTAKSLQEAFNALKGTLDLNPNRDVRYGSTRVVDLAQ